MLHEVLYFVIMSILGALTAVLIWAEKWEDLFKFDSLRHIIIGAIVGVLYWHMYSQWNLPNSVMSFIAGYFGTDFVEALTTRFRRMFSKNAGNDH